MIITERLTLAPIDTKYSKELFELWSDYDVIKYTHASLISTQVECDEKIKEWIEKYTDWNCPNNFVALLNEKVIGIAGFPIIDRENFKCGFYYQIIKRYWGNGYALEIARALLDYIFANHPNATVLADTVSVNLASVRILNRIGFMQTHIEEKGFKNNNMELDIIHLKI